MRRIVFAMLSMLVSLPLMAQDVYEVLRQGGEGYAEVLPGKPLQFPQDHLSHPAYRIEWWYVTANLNDSEGRPWGLHWTLFRQALKPDGDPDGWNSNQVWMAHAALTTPEDHRYEERFARGGIGQAGVSSSGGRFHAWLDDWQLQGDGAEPLPGTLSFRLKDSHVRLQMMADTPWILQGNAGYSLKSAQGQASYYYSQPHIKITGFIEHGGDTVEVSGMGWLDREWSSQPLAENQPGWDWFSLHLDDGSALMIYRLRHEATADNDIPGADWLSGALISPSGEAKALHTTDIQLSVMEWLDVERKARDDFRLPLVWSLSLPGLGDRYKWKIYAPRPDHWLATAFPYWEGPVIAEGSNMGIGYMELTGYE